MRDGREESGTKYCIVVTHIVLSPAYNNWFDILFGNENNKL